MSDRPIELWAGIECTVNRIGDRYRDQLELSGHAGRLDDLDRIASLGVRAVRYPISWERTAPDGMKSVDWSWSDARMDRLRVLGIRPIVGLLHHGSGPRHTSLVDDRFAEGLAEFARAVSLRYPFVTEYTPVNEPLTTARFSGLYGHWYPHLRTEAAFVRALLNQCRATLLAMRAIQETVPDARLVQTEDISIVDDRRWLALDLACGQLDHQAVTYLEENGATEAELLALLVAPCPPSVIGINHHVMGERADCHRDALRGVWERYHLPVALTDVHLRTGGGREKQLRWLDEAWRGAHAERDRGVDVRALTLGSAFGAFDGDSHMVLSRGHYEPGAFDARSASLRCAGTRRGVPRPTAIASLFKELATTGRGLHPLLVPKRTSPLVPCPRACPIVITGVKGTLGKAFARVCEARGVAAIALGRRQMDIADPAAVARVLGELEPWAVVNTAGYVRVDDAEHEREACRRENTLGPALLALACRDRGVKLLTFSTDLVFDGSRGEPYVESDRVAPLGFYGLTKAEAERCVLAILPSALVVRTAALFGPWDARNFVTVALRAMDEGRLLRVAVDCVVSPTYVPDLVHAALDLLIDGASGVWHLANQGLVSWHALALRVAQAARIDASALVRTEDGSHRITALTSERCLILPPLEEAIDRYLQDRLRLA